MLVKKIATGVFVAALMSGTAALAQAPAPSQQSATTSASSEAKPVENQSSSQWRSSKLIGLYVYNDSDERLGSINELLTDSSGKIQKVVIGVGGFLGIGESDVAVNYDQIKFVNEPMKTSSTTSTAPAGTAATGGPATGTAGTVGSATTTTTTTTSAPKVNPDHAKLSATKDQLKNMAQFKYAN